MHHGPADSGSFSFVRMAASTIVTVIARGNFTPFYFIGICQRGSPACRNTDTMPSIFEATATPSYLGSDRRSAATRCRRSIPRLRNYIHQLKTCGIEQLETIGRTLGAWSGEIAAMWRFSKNNGITEGFHNKMEMISRRAFGFLLRQGFGGHIRNFNNYRLRVRVIRLR